MNVKGVRIYMTNWPLVKEVTEIMLALSATIGVVTLFVTKVCRPIASFVHHFIQAAPKIEAIYAELKPNGGASLRDSINRVEHHMIVSDERQRAIMRDNPLGILEIAEDGEVIWANRTMTTRIGRPLVDFFGKGWLGMVTEESLGRISASWDLAFEQKREFNSNVTFVSTEGESVDAHMVMHIMRDSHFKPVGYMGVIEFDPENSLPCGAVCPLLARGAKSDGK